MRGKFRAITQVSCALLLALSLSLMTAVAVTGTELPSISPTEAEYDLDDPADIQTTITWGIASKIVAINDGKGDLTEGLGKDYIVLVKDLIILNTYLEDKLTDIGESVELIIKFDVGAAIFNITAIGNPPSISPTPAQYDLDSPADVKTTITWGIATSIVSIVDNAGHTLTGTQYTVTDIVPEVSANLTILNSPYLAGKLVDIGEEVGLTIKFDVGSNATFNITAIGIQPGISPTPAQYDVDSPADVKTTITWGTATSVVSIKDDAGHTLTGTQYTVTPIVPGVSANLTILNSPYLAGKLKNIGDKVVLNIKFDLGSNATFTITATGINPRVSPQTKEYDLDGPADAQTTITWGTATEVVSIVDGDNHALVENVDYSLTPIDAYNTTLTILHDPYLKSKLTDIEYEVVLTIKFDLGSNATFTITAIGIHPSISPTTATQDVFAPGNVAISITWGTATSVASIVDDDGYTLAAGTNYTITDLGVSANLTILSDPYLAGKLTDIGDEVMLTIDFDVGRNATLTIEVPPICFIATAAYGTPMAEEIQILRGFRDEYLLTNPLGQALVDLYYRVSPPIADFITEHPSLKPIVRAGLVPAVTMSAIALNTTPVEKTAIVGLLVLVSVALAVWATRRRGRGPEYT